MLNKKTNTENFENLVQPILNNAAVACQKSILLQKPYSVTIKETYKLHEYLIKYVNQLYVYIFIYNGIGKNG